MIYKGDSDFTPEEKGKATIIVVLVATLIIWLLS